MGDYEQYLKYKQALTKQTIDAMQMNCPVMEMLDLHRGAVERVRDFVEAYSAEVEEQAQYVAQRRKKGKDEEYTRELEDRFKIIEEATAQWPKTAKLRLDDLQILLEGL